MLKALLNCVSRMTTKSKLEKIHKYIRVVDKIHKKIDKKSLPNKNYSKINHRKTRTRREKKYYKVSKHIEDPVFKMIY